MIHSQAHKLLVLADQLDPPKAAEATDALFAATYEEGKNVSEDAEIEKVSALKLWEPFGFPQSLQSIEPWPS